MREGVGRHFEYAGGWSGSDVDMLRSRPELAMDRRVLVGGHFIDATTLQDRDFWGAGWMKEVREEAKETKSK